MIHFGAQTESFNPCVLQHPQKTSRHSLILRINALVLRWERTRAWCGTQGRKHQNKDCGRVHWLFLLCPHLLWVWVSQSLNQKWSSDMVLYKSFCSKLRSPISLLQQFVTLPSSKGAQTSSVRPPRLGRSLAKGKGGQEAVLTCSPGILMIKKHQFSKSWWTYQTLHLNRSLHGSVTRSTMKCLTPVLDQTVKNQIKPKLVLN